MIYFLTNIIDKDPESFKLDEIDIKEASKIQRDFRSSSPSAIHENELGEKKAGIDTELKYFKVSVKKAALVGMGKRKSNQSRDFVEPGKIDPKTKERDMDIFIVGGDRYGLVALMGKTQKDREVIYTFLVSKLRIQKFGGHEFGLPPRD